MYTYREIYNIACKSIVLTCLEMLFVRLVYISDLIICCSYCFIIYNNINNINNYSNVLLAFFNFVSNYCEVIIRFSLLLNNNNDNNNNSNILSAFLIL